MPHITYRIGTTELCTVTAPGRTIPALGERVTFVDDAGKVVAGPFYIDSITRLQPVVVDPLTPLKDTYTATAPARIVVQLWQVGAVALEKEETV